MKQILAFILLFAYSLAATGTSLQMHFCMGKPSEVRWNAESEKKTCGKCGMEKDEQPNGCCSDEQKWVKIEDDQKTSVLSYIFSQATPPAPLTPHGFDQQLHCTEAADLLPNSHAPPRSSDRAIYKRNSVFRI